MPGSCIERGGHVNWPARSPKLRPLAFFVWGCVNDNVFRASCTSFTRFKRWITLTIRNIPTEMLRHVWQNTQSRISAVIRGSGGYVENISWYKSFRLFNAACRIILFQLHLIYFWWFFQMFHALSRYPVCSKTAQTNRLAVCLENKRTNSDKLRFRREVKLPQRSIWSDKSLQPRQFNYKSDTYAASRSTMRSVVPTTRDYTTTHSRILAPTMLFLSTILSRLKLCRLSHHKLHHSGFWDCFSTAQRTTATKPRTNLTKVTKNCRHQREVLILDNLTISSLFGFFCQPALTQENRDTIAAGCSRAKSSSTVHKNDPVIVIYKAKKRAIFTHDCKRGIIEPKL